MKKPFNSFIAKPYPEGSITQFFNENQELYSKSVCINGTCLLGHNGLDCVAPWGTPIFAIEGGIVCEVKEDSGGYGKHIRIITKTNREYTYGHLSRVDVTLGQEINEGEQIGLMGNTGFVVSGSTPYWEYNPYAGTHLHLTIRECQVYTGQGYWNIEYKLPDGKSIKGMILNHGNGFFGAIDPMIILAELDSTDNVVQEETIKGLQLTVISLANQAIELLKKIISLRT